jgi:hypothetical protein
MLVECTNRCSLINYLTHFHSLTPIQIHCSTLEISFLLANVCFQVTLASERPSSTNSFYLHLIIHLDRALVGIAMGTSNELMSISKYYSLTSFDEKLINCSTSKCCLVPFLAALFSTCSFTS